MLHDVGQGIIEDEDFNLRFSNKRSKATIDVIQSENPKGDMADNDSDEEDLVDGCPICFEPWSSNGLHRVCSLRCGHIFGKQCIETWLSSSRLKCPQCNSPATKKDIRVLFVKCLKAVDNTERDELLKQLEEERKLRKICQDRENQLQISYNLAMAELNSLKSQLSKFQNIQNETKNSFSVSNFKFSKSVIFPSDMNCRNVTFDHHSQVFIVGAAKGINDHGIAKVSVFDDKIDFFKIHSHLIKDISCSPHHDGTVLSASFDRSLTLSSLQTNSILLSYRLDAPAWSCCFDENDRNIIYTGLANGTVVAFDIRSTDSILWSRGFESSQGKHAQIHSLNHSASSVPFNNTENRHGSDCLFAASFNGISCTFEPYSDQFHTASINELDYFLSKNSAKCSSMSFSRNSRASLLSTRGSNPEHFLFAKNIMGKLEYVNLIACDTSQSSIVRSSLVNLDQSESFLGVLPDGTSAILCHWNNGSLLEKRSIPTNSAAPLLGSFAGMLSANDQVLVSLLSERQLNIFSN